MQKIILLLLSLLLLTSCAQVNKTGNLIWHGDLNSNKIYLTFDDGPHPQFTPAILDILKENKIKATFFVKGEKAEKHKDIIKRIRREGHEIGNHTYSHCDGYNVNEEKIKKELINTDKIIKKITGSSPKYFRPPFGFFNFRYIQLAEELGYKTILWTFDAGDWKKIKANEIENKVLSKTKGGSIILLHDGGENREELIKALPNIISKLKNKKFSWQLF